MSSEARSAHELTQRLVLRASTGRNGPEASVLAVQSACEFACAELSLSLGPPGFYALLKRALVQAEPEYPFLKNVRVNRHTSPVFDGLGPLVEENGAAQVASALESVLDLMFTALGRLIGEDLVERLVEREVTVATPDHVEPA